MSRRVLVIFAASAFLGLSAILAGAAEVSEKLIGETVENAVKGLGRPAELTSLRSDIPRNGAAVQFQYPGVALIVNFQAVVGIAATEREAGPIRGIRVGDNQSKALELFGDGVESGSNASGATWKQKDFPDENLRMRAFLDKSGTITRIELWRLELQARVPVARVDKLPSRPMAEGRAPTSRSAEAGPLGLRAETAQLRSEHLTRSFAIRSDRRNVNQAAVEAEEATYKAALSRLLSRARAEKSQDAAGMADLLAELDRDAEVIPFAQKAIEASSTDFVSHGKLVLALCNLQRFDEALAILHRYSLQTVEASKAVSYVSAMELPYELLSRRLVVLGRREEARQAIESWKKKITSFEVPDSDRGQMRDLVFKINTIHSSVETLTDSQFRPGVIRLPLIRAEAWINTPAEKWTPEKGKVQVFVFWKPHVPESLDWLLHVQRRATEFGPSNVQVIGLVTRYPIAWDAATSQVRIDYDATAESSDRSLAQLCKARGITAPVAMNPDQEFLSALESGGERVSVVPATVIANRSGKVVIARTGSGKGVDADLLTALPPALDSPLVDVEGELDGLFRERFNVRRAVAVNPDGSKVVSMTQGVISKDALRDLAARAKASNSKEHAALAKVYSLLEDFENERIQSQLALKSNPSDVKLRFALLSALNRLGELKDALKLVSELQQVPISNENAEAFDEGALQVGRTLVKLASTGQVDQSRKLLAEWKSKLDDPRLRKEIKLGNRASKREAVSEIKRALEEIEWNERKAAAAAAQEKRLAERSKALAALSKQILGKPFPSLRPENWVNGEPPAGEQLKGTAVLYKFVAWFDSDYFDQYAQIKALQTQYSSRGLVTIGVRLRDKGFWSAKEQNKVSQLTKITKDESDQSYDAFARARGMPFVVGILADSSSLSTVLTVEQDFLTSTMFLVDEAGVVRGVYPGCEKTDYERLSKDLDTLLPQQK